MASPHRWVTTLLVSALAVTTLVACGDAEGSVKADVGHEPVPVGQRTPGSARPSEAKAPQQVPLVTDRPRRSPGVVAAGGGDSPYNYGPTLIAENGKYRMWWCSQLGIAQPPGDDLLHSESASIDGPFAAPDGSQAMPVLSGSYTGFDGMHTCDPSVVRVSGTYYLYYTGAAGDHAHGNAIGVATSPDGIVWQRANNGKPIVSPSYDTIRQNTYGAGQPSVLYLDGWFYLMFTDTTGQAAGWNGAGQFVLRSKDPLFTSGVQSLSDKGFSVVSAASAPRSRSLVDAFSADWTWIDALGAFAIAHETDNGTTLTFWNSDFTANPYQPVTIAGPWQEGPGLVRAPDGHAPVSADDPCRRVPVDVVRATVIGAAGAPTDLSHFGLDLMAAQGCATRQESEVLDGYAVPSPERTTDLVIGGKVLRVERRSVSDRLAKRVLEDRPPIVDQLPVVATLQAGAKTVRSPEGLLGVVLDDGKLWMIGTAEVAQLNSSQITDISTQEWARYERGSDLTALRR
jgi:hypothetical protein